jgi:antitoxin (DNA-binding transcriptional repressor) of toxin-antitoxin stability system
MRKKVISVTDLSRTFSDIIGRVHYMREEYEIKKGTNIVARLSPASFKQTITAGELEALFRNAPHLANSDIEEFEDDISKVKELKDIQGFNKWD